MSLEDLKKSLRRLQKKDYEHFFHHWKPSVAAGRPLQEMLDDDLLHSLHKLQKKTFTQAVLALFSKKKPKTTDVAKVDLLYMQLHSKSYIWHCYCLEQDGDGRTQNPTEFSARLQQELQLLFDDAEVQTMLAENVYWTRVELHQQTARGYNLRSRIYIIHQPHTPYFIATTMRATQAGYLLEAIEQVLSGHDGRKLLLTGHCVHSLLRILLHGDTQGEYNKYHLNQVDENPLSGSKKRKLEESDNECVEIVNENQDDRHRRKSLLEDTFGIGQQPTLEKLEYKIESQFKGTSVLPAMARREETLHFRVKFEGKSVMEGMRGLGKAGLAELPMKNHLCRHIYTRRTNTLLLTQKRTRDTTI